MPLDAPDIWESAGRLLMALVFSGIVGWEREAKGRPAGLRTHILVALGAAGFTLVSIALYAESVAAGHAPPFDPGRIISTIVGGVGFLGAGAIIQSRGEVHGLTTAASIWLVAAVGVASGAGLYTLSTLMAALALVTLVLIKWIERRWFDEEEAKGKSAEVAEGADDEFEPPI